MVPQKAKGPVSSQTPTRVREWFVLTRLENLLTRLFKCCTDMEWRKNEILPGNI